jgi:hypothetical protein
VSLPVLTPCEIASVAMTLAARRVFCFFSLDTTMAYICIKGGVGEGGGWRGEGVWRGEYGVESVV